MNTTDNLEQFLPILRTASIFSGMSDSEILSVLHCMGAFVSDKEKRQLPFTCRRYDINYGTAVIGKCDCNSGRCMGTQKYHGADSSGTDLCRTLCRFQRYCIKYQCRSNERLFPAVLRYSPHFRGLPVCLRTSHTFNPEPDFCSCQKSFYCLMRKSHI